MTARTQTTADAGFKGSMGTATIAEVRKHINAALDKGLSALRSDTFKYAVHPLKDGSISIRVTKIGAKKPERIKPSTETSDIEAALAEARQRGKVRVAEILAGEDMASADAFAAMLGISRQSLHGKLAKHQVLGLEGAKRGYRFPQWQVGADGRPFAALPQLHQSFDGPWAVFRFLKQYHPELDATGLEALQQNRTDEVLALAQNLDRSSG